jgi:hypothetical protein
MKEGAYVPSISVTVEVPWPNDKLTFSKLERTIHRAAMTAGRKALVAALGAWEAELLPAAGARQRRVRRYLLTRVGPIRFFRWKTRSQGDYGFPLDRAMGLLPHQSCSTFVWERACRLAAAHPYRTAARLLSDLIGVSTDHRVLWRLVQKAGRLRRDQIEANRADMFDLGLAPAQGEPIEMVVTEIDGAVLRRQGGGVMEAKVAAAYTGKELASATAAHRRVYITGKALVAGIYPEGVAGQAIYAQLCRSVGLHRARHSLVAGDGAEWIPVMCREYFPEAVYQLDHYHLKSRLRVVAGNPERAGRWIAWALSGRWRSIERSMSALVARGRLDAKVARETLAYLQVNHRAIWAHRTLLARGAPPELCTRGSGVIEHTIDLLVARRMKRQGMRWSKEGAHNMLALRSLLLDPPSWRAWWKEVVL